MGKKMTEIMIKEMILKLFKQGLVPVLKVFYELIISYLKNNKPIALGLGLGLLFGSWLSSFFNWIPLFGNIIGLILTILGGIVGIYITYLIKKEQNGK
jgi:ABC-type lipoprotein release transport system permease subunit